MRFLRKVMPSAVKTHGFIVTWEEADPDIYEQAYNFLFNNDPIVLPANKLAAS
jgi:hypothetical protein